MAVLVVEGGDDAGHGGARDGSRHGTTRAMAQHHEHLGPKDESTELQGPRDLRRDDVARHARHEDVAETDNSYRGRGGVRRGGQRDGRGGRRGVCDCSLLTPGRR